MTPLRIWADTPSDVHRRNDRTVHALFAVRPGAAIDPTALRATPHTFAVAGVRVVNRPPDAVEATGNPDAPYRGIWTIYSPLRAAQWADVPVNGPPEVPAPGGGSLVRFEFLYPRDAPPQDWMRLARRTPHRFRAARGRIARTPAVVSTDDAGRVVGEWVVYHTEAFEPGPPAAPRWEPAHTALLVAALVLALVAAAYWWYRRRQRGSR